MSAASLINKNGQVVTVIRAIADLTIVDGFEVLGQTESLTMKAYISDAKGKDTVLDQMGNRNQRSVTIYTVAELFPQRDERPADKVVTLDGVVFQVMAVKTYKGKASVTTAEELDD